MAVQQTDRQRWILGAQDDATPFVEPEDGLAGQVVFQVSNIGSLTVQFEATAQKEASPASIVAVRAENLSNGTFATTATGDGLYRVDAAGLRVRARVSAFTSGSVQVDRAHVIG